MPGVLGGFWYLVCGTACCSSAAYVLVWFDGLLGFWWLVGVLFSMFGLGLLLFLWLDNCCVVMLSCC